LEEGTPPRDNTHTRAADLYLTQAQSIAEEAEAAQRWQQGLESALAGIEADPENPKSYFQAGLAYVGLKDYTAADSMLSRAEEIHPRYILETVPWRERGWVQAYNDAIIPMNSGDLEAAAELFEMADALYDERPEAKLQLASLYSRLDRLDESVEVYRGTMALLEETREEQMMDSIGGPAWEQHWGIATTGLGQVLTMAERYDEASQLYGELLAEDPDNLTVLGTLANVLSELGQVDSVRALYDQLLSRTDLGERDLFNAGVGLYQIEDYERAASAFRQASERNDFNRDAILNLAQTLSISEDFEGLIPVSRRLLEMDPRNALGWIFLTRALSETGDTEGANEVFTEYQAIGYEIEDLRLEPDPTGGAVILGQLKNTSLEPGTAVTLRFTFGGEAGTAIGSIDINVSAPEVEQFEVFRAEFTSTEIVTGYIYEVIAP
jgi:tetratricopeptide (TPR) repeat protein